MRTRITILTGALLVTSALVAQAQDVTPAPAQAPQQSTASTFTPKLGMIDFGYRGTSFSGDEARYNRYRDLRDGPTVNRFRFDNETDTRVFRADAANVGYRDQRYAADFQQIGKLKAAFNFDSNPLFQVLARGYFTGVGTGTLTINDAAQQAIQASPANAEAALAAYGQDYNIQGRRDVARFNMTYTAMRDLDVKVQVRNTNRSGTNLQDFGFGSSPGNMLVLDMPVPVDDRTTDLKTKVEWANRQGLVAVGWDGSWYNQNNPAFTFDNPQRAIDSPTAGPAFGRAALMPSNSFNTFNANGAVKLAGHSRATAALSYGMMDDNEPLLATTTNSALVGLPALPRNTAEAKVDVTSMVLGFNSRPLPDLWLNARFRYYDYNNKTPAFTTTVVPGDYTIGAVETSEPTAFNRKTFDVDASYSPIRYVDFGAGYTRENYDNHLALEPNVQGRIYGQTSEDTYRFTIDSVGNQYLSARLKYENSSRTGQDLDEDLLAEIGEQVGMRQYDLAPRDRDAVSGVFTVTPTGYFDVNATVSYGHDKYPRTADVNALNPTGVTFGLLDNKNRGFGFGVDVAPNDVVNASVGWERQKYDTFQYSRTANPLSATDQTFLDPRRDWSDTINDKVDTWSADLNLIKAISRTDIRLSYDLSDGATNYLYGLAPITTLAQPVQYSIQPKNRMEVARLDVDYFVRANVALGLGYWYEHYKVQDFALNPAIIDALIVRNPANNALTGFYTGYAFEPYTANTVFVRMRYLW